MNNKMYTRSHLLKAAFFSFATRMVKLGNQRKITVEDILSLEKSDLPGANASKIEDAYAASVEQLLRQRSTNINSDGYRSVCTLDSNVCREQLDEIEDEVSHPQPMLLVWIFFRSFWREFAMVALLRLIKSSFQLTVLAYILPKLLTCLKPPYATMQEGLALAFFLFLFTCLQQLFYSQYFYHSMRCGMKLNGAFVLVVYRKILKMRTSESSIGELVNMVSNDSQRLSEFGINFHNLYAGALEATIMLALIVRNAGSVGFLSLLIVLPFGPIMAIIGRKISTLSGLVTKITDERMKMINETVMGIKAVKMYCWEIPFAKVINRVREKEIQHMWSRALCLALTNIVSTTMPVLVGLLVFCGYALMHGEMMNSATAFSTLALINLLRIPMVQLPIGIRSCSEVFISVQRLSEIISLKEISFSKYDPFDAEAPEVIGVRMFSGEFDWGAIGGNSKSMRSTLTNITFRVRSGEIVAVCGHVGSGKSSLLAAIMKEIPRLAGSVCLSGKIAYVPQEAFIMNGSLRDNILFGLPFENKKYKEIIRKCCLEPDLLLLKDGDLTEIGERGMTISGGQKQRLSLARALYSDADIYLLDDPLSAVDQQVGRILFEDCICEYLAKKCVVFVTHQIQHFNRCQNIIFMKDGTIAETGAFNELVANGLEFANFVNSYIEPTDIEHKHMGYEDDASRSREMKRSRNISMQGEIQNGEHENQAHVQLKTETSSFRSIPLRVYLGYFESMGGVRVFAGVLFMFVLAEVVKVVAEFWLAHWIRVSNLDKAAGVLVKQTYYVSVYCAMIGSLFILGFLRALCLYTATLRVAKNVHSRVYANVIQAPMSFFDTTPIGQLLNRFSSDISVLDEKLSESIVYVMLLGCQIVGILLIIFYMFPQFICVLIPLAYAYNRIQREFRFCSRDLRRLELAARTPTYSLLGETLLGLASVRAFRRGSAFEREMENRMQLTLRAGYSFWVASRWLGIRLDMISCIVILFTGVFSVMSKGTVSDNVIGLLLMYSLSLAVNLEFAVRNLIEAEAQFTSVQRLQEYAKNVQPERGLGLSKDLALVMCGKEKEVKALCVPDGYPQNGQISFRGFSMKYRKDLPDILHSIDLDIKAGEKIGVVGRTGAGKSSLAAALFRLVEIQNMCGSIIIDGKDILKLPLWHVRREMSIIPQEPILFIGSVRYNLDPFNEVEDLEIWKALENIDMLQVVDELPGKLDFQIVENGNNFSVGQRQLLCIGRALLQKVKIILMDEATASIDPETDQSVQASIRNGFANCTVITIAHRINTIIDSDRVLVMDKGVVKEFDTPANLLRIQGGSFLSLVEQTGPITTGNLKNVAFSKEEGRLRKLPRLL